MKHFLIIFILTFPLVAGTVCAIVNSHHARPLPFLGFYIVTGVLFILQDRYRWFRKLLVGLILSYGAYLFLQSPPRMLKSLKSFSYFSQPASLHYYSVMIIVILMLVFYFKVIARA